MDLLRSAQIQWVMGKTLVRAYKAHHLILLTALQEDLWLEQQEFDEERETIHFCQLECEKQQTERFDAEQSLYQSGIADLERMEKEVVGLVDKSECLQMRGGMLGLLYIQFIGASCFLGLLELCKYIIYCIS